LSEKKILHITGMASTKYGGLEQYLFELARVCNEKKYNIILQYEKIPKSKNYMINLSKLDVNIIIKKINTYPIKSIIHVIKLIKMVKPDIIHIHFANKYVLFVTPKISKILGVKKILYTKHGDPKLGKKSFQRLIYNQYDHILPVSESIANNLFVAGINPNKISLHYLGIFGNRKKSNQLKFKLRKQLKIPNHAIVLGCIAFDNPLKGLDLLLKAFAKVIYKKSQVHLVIIGVNPLISILPKQAEELGIANKVHWIGIIDNGWKILNVADLYVQPSRYEGLGFAILEAMALKLPIIATHVGGIPEIVKDGENGYLTEPDCINSLANTINHMILNPQHWEKMGEMGYKRYKDSFDGEKSVKLLVEKYYKL